MTAPEDEVWITGLGAVTGAGIGVTALAEALVLCRTAAHPSSTLGDRWVAQAGEVELGRDARRLDRSGRLLLAAAQEAWEEAGLARGDVAPGRVGVIEGTSLGPLGEALAMERERTESGHHESHPGDLIRLMFDSGGATFAQEVAAHGPVYALSAGSVSGTLAIAEAYWKILHGQADIMVAGGAECPLNPDIVGAFDTAGILAPAGGAEVPCRPFDAHRSGTILGEGAGILVLESPRHARRRGAIPRAILAGAGLSCETHGMILPDPTGIGVADATRQALGAISADDVGWIKAHGTGTRSSDLAECRGLESVFNGGLARIPITGLKPLVGHCLGASGAVEAVAAVLALESGNVPPTLGTEQVDAALPRCTIALEPVPVLQGSVLLLSQSFGGRCAALVMKRAA